MEILGQKSYACWYCSPVVVKRRRNDPQVLCLNRSDPLVLLVIPFRYLPANDFCVARVTLFPHTKV